jgi:hypothetical protein
VSSKKYDPIDGEWGDHGEASLRQYIRSCGYTADKHPHGKFGLDVEYVSETERFYADVERRTLRTWSGDAWFPSRWQTLHVLARRPVKPGILFFTMSADMTKAYVSFPEDLETVKPERMNNIHASGELVRDHEIMRCLPLDLTVPIKDSIARMNAARVREIVRTSNSYSVVKRTLCGQEPYGFGSPYGIGDEEWKELLFELERRCGLPELAARKKRDIPQKTFAF